LSCWSRSCHQDVGNHFIDLIGWALSKKAGREVLIDEVCEWIDNPSFSEKERSPIVVNDQPFNKNDYPSIYKPSNYYSKRGFSSDILNKFGVGDSLYPPYKDRAIVPIKNKTGELMGFTARSIWEKCPHCEYYHSKYQVCISKDDKYAFMNKKWLHSKGLRVSSLLYNIENIKENKVAIVEGPSCVWRLDELGIPAVACLGKEFSKYRANLLKRMDIDKILFISDNDEAGNLFKKDFIKEYSKDFGIYLPTKMDKKDVSEMNVESIKMNILKVWEKI
jgi:5S rRNA maturation endonuclease (ribonuclease M5)